MGRFYHGDIEGKFWFGIQDSDDAVEFGKDYETLYEYLVCGCCYVEREDYCTMCYSSKEEHFKAIVEDDGTVKEDDEYIQKMNSIKFSFFKYDIKAIEDKVEELFIKISDEYEFDFDCFELEFIGNEYNADWSSAEDVKEECLQPLATYCLGKQILRHLENNDECSFYCDL